MKAGPLLVLKCFCLATLAVPWQTFRQDMDHASIIKAQMQRAGSQAGIAYVDLYMWLSSIAQSVCGSTWSSSMFTTWACLIVLHCFTFLDSAAHTEPCLQTFGSFWQRQGCDELCGSSERTGLGAEVKQCETMCRAQTCSRYFQTQVK